MTVVLEFDAKRHICPFLSGRPCAGQACMAWVWVGHTTEQAHSFAKFSKDIYPTTEDMPKPDAVGQWQPDGGPRARGRFRHQEPQIEIEWLQSWTREIEQTRGRCGRVEPIDADLPF